MVHTFFHQTHTHNGLRTQGFSWAGKDNMLSWQELLLKANMEELRCAMPRLQKEPQAQVMSSFFTVVFTSYHKPLPSGA